MTLLLGDCLERLREMESDSVDSIVTDPPAGISFMGKSWDSDKGGRDEWIKWMQEVMEECLRVMKPGAHGLVWSLPRTSHWTATSLENAGFEMRDCVTHLFGSGFPKSLDISKAIDKAAGVKEQDRPIVGPNPSKRPNSYVGENGWETPMRPDYKRSGSTDAAKQWQGWGTALKPAAEFWWLIRKPCSEKTVAANVLKWGVGGINIDAGRVESIGDHKRSAMPSNNKNLIYEGNGFRMPFNPTNAEGRFPANLVFSHSPYCTDEMCDIECAIARLDEQSGDRPSFTGGGQKGANKKTGNEAIKSFNRSDASKFIRHDSGGASRFFYCAKISSSERNAGLPDGVKSSHPTVKPKKLMAYLIKLITPPSGTVLDPFMGSGSTGVAAKEHGFRFIGIEREQEYFEIARARVKA